MRLGLGLGLGLGVSLVATPVAVVDFSTATTGAFTDWPAGLSHSRASTANTPTSNGQAYTMGVAIDAGAIADWHGVRGLLHTRGYTNLLSAPRNSSSWQAASNGTTTSEQTGSPDGTSHVSVHAINSGGWSKYTNASVVAGRTYTAWCLAKPGSGNYQISFFDSVDHRKGGALVSGWQVIQSTSAAGSTTTGGMMPADGRNGTTTGGIAAGSRSYSTDMHVLAEAPYALPYHDTTLAPSSLTASVEGYGRIRFRAKITWLCGSSALTENPTLWYIDGLNYAEIDRNSRAIRVVVDGYPIRLTIAGVGLAVWAAGATHDITIDCGGGKPTGRVVTNGVTSAFDAVVYAHGALWSFDAPLYLLSRAGTSRHADCIVQQLGVYGLVQTPTTTVYYTSPTGSGDGLTQSTPASLSNALALAETALANGDRVRVVATASGTFDVGAGLEWGSEMSGLTLATMPGVSCTMSGAVDATTGWTVDSGSRYKRAFPAGTSGRLQIIANGTRATVASSAVSSGGLSGWSRSVSGFTAADSTIAGYAHPNEVEIVTRSSTATWKHGLLTVTGAVGTAIACDALDVAAADFQVGYTLDKPIAYRGVKELVAAGTFAVEQATNTLYYQFRSGETPNSTTVRVAATEHVLTIDGASNVTVVGFTIADTKWDRATVARSGNAYPYGGGGGGGYVSLQDGVCGGPGGNYWVIPAAVTFRACTNVWLHGCTVTRCGGDGLAMETGAKNSGHRGCVFADVSGHHVRKGFVLPEDQRPSEEDTPSDLWDWSASFSNGGTEFADCAHSSAFFVRRARSHYCISTSAKWSAFTRGFGWSYADAGGGGWPAGYTSDPTTPTVNSGGQFAYCKALSAGTELVDNGAFYINGAQNGGTSMYCYATAGGGGLSFYLDNGCTGETLTSCVGQAAFFAQTGAPPAHNNTLVDSISGNLAVGFASNGNTSTNHRVVTFPFVDATALAIDALAGLA